MIEGKDDGEDFRRLQSAMDILHFSPEDQSGVFRVLSSILHLGNVFFHRLEVPHAYASLSCVLKPRLRLHLPPPPSYSDRRARGGGHRKRPGDPRGGRAAADFSGSAAEIHHLQSDGKTTHRSLRYQDVSLLSVMTTLSFIVRCYSVMRSELVAKQAPEDTLNYCGFCVTEKPVTGSGGSLIDFSGADSQEAAGKRPGDVTG